MHLYEWLRKDEWSIIILRLTGGFPMKKLWVLMLVGLLVNPVSAIAGSQNDEQNGMWTSEPCDTSIYGVIKYNEYTYIIEPTVVSLFKDETRDGIQMETIRLEMRYDKKKKSWYGRQRALRIKENNGYREMTEDELEKYNLIWNESEFLI